MFMHLTGARGADFPGVGVHWCATEWVDGTVLFPGQGPRSWGGRGGAGMQFLTLLDHRVTKSCNVT